MKTIIKSLLAILVIIATMYGEYYWPLLGILVAMLLLPCSFIIKEDVGGLQILTASILYCSSFFYLAIGLRAVVHHKDSYSVDIVSPFYPCGQVLATGIRLDTVQLAVCIEETYYGEYKIKMADNIYVLTAKDSTTQIVFKNTEEVIRGQLEFKDLNTAHGAISLCQFTDKGGVQHVWDLYGQDANAKNYSPHIIAYKPDYYYYPN